MRAVSQPPDVERDPDADEHALEDQEDGCAEEAGEALRLPAEPVAAEDRGQVQVRGVEAEMMLGALRRAGGLRGRVRHESSSWAWKGRSRLEVGATRRSSPYT